MIQPYDNDSSLENANEEEMPIGYWNIRPPKEENSANQIPVRKIYVTNIHAGTKGTDLKEFFSKFGTVVEAYVRSGRKTYRRSQYYAFVTFATAEEAEKAICARRSQLKLRERVLYVSAANIKHQPDKEIEVSESTKQKFLVHVDRSENFEEYELEDDGYLMRKRPCKINDLNDDCLSMIFSYLSTKEKLMLETVCKRWRVVLLDQWSRVTRLDFHNIPEVSILTDSILGIILQRCGASLLRLDLPTNHNLTGDALHVIASLCKNLEHLGVYAIRMRTSAIKLFTLKCKRMKSLVLREPIGVRDQDLKMFFDRLRLHSFSLTQRTIDGMCLIGLPPTLKHLDLSSCNELIMSNLLTGLSNTPNLRSLKFDVCAILTNSDLEAVCAKVPFIEEFSLINDFPILNGQALECVQTLTYLRKLDISFNVLVDDGAVAAITGNCKKLEVLNISGCCGMSACRGVTNSGIKTIAQCSRIIDLSMSYLSGVTDEAFFSLAEAGKLKRLQCLGCPGISDEGSSRLISLCLELEYLDISGCANITSATSDMAVKTLSLRPDAKRLVLIVGGTQVIDTEIPVPNSSLKVSMADNCIERLKPDFAHDAFLEDSDDDHELGDPDLSDSDDDYDYFDDEDDDEDLFAQDWL